MNTAREDFIAWARSLSRQSDETTAHEKEAVAAWDRNFLSARVWRAAYAAGQKAERAECAQLCDELAELNRKASSDSMWQQGECAAAIRARGTS